MTATTPELSPNPLADLKAHLDGSMLPSRRRRTNQISRALAIASHNVLMMYEYKVRPCPWACPHEWTSCPFAHPGEVARRRDPARVDYCAMACPEFRRWPAGGGACPRGSACPFAHGTFEQWLHPTRYRTLPCLAGALCARPVCFFAHTANELRLLGHNDDAAIVDGSPRSTLAAWQEFPPLSADEGGGLNMDMRRLVTCNPSHSPSSVEGGDNDRNMERSMASEPSSPLSPVEGGSVNMDMKRLIASQQIRARKETQDAVLWPTSTTSKNDESKHNKPDFRWFHDLLM